MNDFSSLKPYRCIPRGYGEYSIDCDHFSDDPRIISIFQNIHCSLGVSEHPIAFSVLSTYLSSINFCYTRIPIIYTGDFWNVNVHQFTYYCFGKIIYFNLRCINNVFYFSRTIYISDLQLFNYDDYFDYEEFKFESKIKIGNHHLFYIFKNFFNESLEVFYALFEKCFVVKFDDENEKYYQFKYKYLFSQEEVLTEYNLHSPRMLKIIQRLRNLKDERFKALQPLPFPIREEIKKYLITE